jgi:NTE family protein
MKLSRFYTVLLTTLLLIGSTFAPSRAQQLAASPPKEASVSTTVAAQSANGAQTPHRLRVGLALGGGGTRGIAHITAIRILEKNGIPIDCIAGTSMGAIVGGLYCAGVSTADIEKIFWSKAFVRSYDTVPIPVRVSLIPLFFVPHLFGHHPYDGLYRGNRFANHMDSIVDPTRRNIEDLKIPFHAVATNLLDGKSYVITKGNLGRAMQASSAVPGLRRPVEIDKALLVDGGVCANLPVKACRDMGADIVIAVDVDEPMGTLPADHFRKIGTVAYRCLNIHLTTIDTPGVEAADYVIHPDVAGIKLLSRDKVDMNLALIEGKKATEQSVADIKNLIDTREAQLDSGDKRDLHAEK